MKRPMPAKTRIRRRLIPALSLLLALAGCDPKPEVALPDNVAATALFESLHQGIYQAFAQREEGAIYDSLSDSVSGELLDQIYQQVYDSLVAREHGDVVSEIISVDTVEVEITEPARNDAENGPTFLVRAIWEVNSVAEHEAHRHLRSNQYEGLYRVTYLPQGWRIVADRILRQRRLGDEWTPTSKAPVSRDAS
jgi:hypothetical protein